MNKLCSLTTVLVVMVEEWQCGLILLVLSMNKLSSLTTVLVGDGGGMVVWVDSISTFNEQVVFSGNSAGYDGGGMAVEWMILISTFNEQVEFSGNSAGG